MAETVGQRGKGFANVIIGTMFWGFSGAVAQYLFTALHVQPLWLVAVRLLGAGVLLLLFAGLRGGRDVFRIWHNRRDAVLLIIFAIMGMMPSQLTYFLAVSYGNAATATVLQFLGPLFIIIYLALASRQWPRRIDVVSIVVALVGTYLLVTQGRLTSLALAPAAVVWGVLAGVSQASYTLLPRPLLRKYDETQVVGWAMLLGGVPLWPVLGTTAAPHLGMAGLAAIAFIILFGTLFAYLLYLNSLAYIPASTTGMLSAFEPLTATVTTVLLLGTRLAGAEIIGGLLILLTTVLQALPARRATRVER
ncbi:DMT family transporter [Lacticaseibacillus thailandensis]|uniref:DMT superfamily drug metabolite transporter n=1 Tax=Lacticaseibacillus thailandensis DSM 22698 = JCM 13996 TaxID=1423810 RepID=A0A0R2CEZ2_9LACO|nr:DMT family transporter [Lacticaseibacillus thailandensis]KRM86985.1 DMT superfamily drug metabolite transporter [Lacticaseibacillus thailandensis DSM 22698 = JCM 13996]